MAADETYIMDGSKQEGAERVFKMASPKVFKV